MFPVAFCLKRDKWLQHCFQNANRDSTGPFAKYFLSCTPVVWISLFLNKGLDRVHMKRWSASEREAAQLKLLQFSSDVITD